jgi:hypothetical protein
MGQSDLLLLDSFWTAREPVAILRCELLCSPDRGSGGIRVEVADVDSPDCCPIVVPRNADGRKLAQPSHALVGLRAIAHHITQTPERVDRAHVVEHRLERGQICMNIADDPDPHGSPQTTLG